MGGRAVNNIFVLVHSPTSSSYMTIVNGQSQLHDSLKQARRVAGDNSPIVWYKRVEA